MRVQQKTSVHRSPFSRVAEKAKKERAAQGVIKFEVGQKVFYPGHGLGQVVSIESREFCPGVSKTYYVMRIIETGLKAWVAPEDIQKVGVRPVISKKEAEKIYGMLKEKKLVVEMTTWNRRSREYLEKIKTGSIFEIAEVVRDLCIIRADKVLSFGEKRMLEQAKGLLVKELAIADATDEPTVEARIEEIFGPAAA